MQENLGSTSANISIEGTVIAHIYDGDRLVRTIEGKNIVTNDGDLYYAQMAVGGTTVTDDFTAGGIRLGTGTTTPAKADTDVETFVTSASKAESAGYPKTNDTDSNNSGGGTDIVTWKFVFAAGDFTGSAIAEGAIVDNITTPTAALCHWKFAATFDVLSTNSVTVFTNHTFNGT